MPFAGDVGAVTGIVQQFGQGGDVGAEHAFVARTHFGAGRQALACFGHHAQPGNVRVIARHQHCAGGGATGRGMKVQHQAAVGQQLVQVRGLDLAAQGGQVRKTEVIGDDKQNVWLLNCLRSHGLAGAEHEQAEGGKGFEAVHLGALVVLMRFLHVRRRVRRRAGQILAPMAPCRSRCVH